jgi:preprotein translocase subunit SecF
MFKLAVMMHMLFGTMLAGILVLVVLAVPSLAESGMKLILPAAIVGFVVGIFPSIWAAKAILSRTNGQ